MRLNDIIDRIKLPFRKDKELFCALHQIMGFYPHHIEHYKVALTHKSSGMRNEKGRPLNNERLEFLGDAMLSAVVGHIVYDHFTNKREGFLTNTRSKLVSRESLGHLATEMGLVDLIHFSGQQNAHNSYMAGNAFEALVGAIYLDQGYDAVVRFVKKRILKQMINLDTVAYKEVNFKSKLLEWTQKNRVKIEFKIQKQATDDKGSPVFAYQVMIEGLQGGKGKGFSKKEAQQVAAQETLLKLRREPQFIDAIFQAKSDRTKMEEEPTTAAPRMGDDDIPSVSSAPKTPKASKAPKASVTSVAPEASAVPKASVVPVVSEASAAPESSDEFDLSDITHDVRELSREDIIAAAEEAAFSEHDA